MDKDLRSLYNLPEKERNIILKERRDQRDENMYNRRYSRDMEINSEYGFNDEEWCKQYVKDMSKTHILEDDYNDATSVYYLKKKLEWVTKNLDNGVKKNSIKLAIRKKLWKLGCYTVS